MFSIKYLLHFSNNFQYRLFLNHFGCVVYGGPSQDLESARCNQKPSEIRNTTLHSAHLPVSSVITQNDSLSTDIISNQHPAQTILPYPHEKSTSISSSSDVIVC